MENLSFFRYPGGKAKFRKFIIPKIEKYFEENKNYDSYCEPFFGGGSIGFSLLENPNIKNFYFNDIDLNLISLYKSVQFYHEDLIDKIKNYIPKVEDFFVFKEELLNTIDFPENKEEILELGFKKLVLHQISFSGLGTKSGSPLGGINQNSQYKINCRWSPDNLIKKIKKLNDILQQKNVIFSNKNFSELNYNNCFFYFDPPYVHKGKELYQFYFEDSCHEELFNFIKKLDKNWLLSYDGCEEIESLYKNYNIEPIDVNYTINNSTKKKEFLIYSYDF